MLHSASPVRIAVLAACWCQPGLDMRRRASCVCILLLISTQGKGKPLGFSGIETASDADPCAGVACDLPSPNGCYNLTKACSQGSCCYAPLSGKACGGYGVCKAGTCTASNCTNSRAGGRALTAGASAAVYSSPWEGSSTGALISRCEAFTYLGVKSYNAFGDSKCYRKIKTKAGTVGWILESGIATVPNAACPKDPTQACVDTGPGTRVLTAQDSAPVYASACQTNATGATVKRCEPFYYYGAKLLSSCGDHLCYRLVKSAGGVVGWVLNSGINSFPSPSCPAGPPVCAEVPASNGPSGGSGVNLTFMVVGDWGMKGQADQTKVAAIMAARAATLDPEFVAAVGDNFYPSGLNGTSDPLFDLSFKKVYTQQSLQVPWYAVLGNHDYGDASSYASCLSGNYACLRSPANELGESLAFRDSRWFGYRSGTKTLAGGLVQLFFLDTSPFISGYWATSWAGYPGGVLEQSWQQQYCQLKADLAASCAVWKLAFGHHPGHSNGAHGKNAEIIQYLEPLFIQYGVQAYFAGHDHDLELLRLPGTNFYTVVSGAGSGVRPFYGKAYSLFQAAKPGFVAASVNDTHLLVEFHHLASKGKPAYTATIPKE